MQVLGFGRPSQDASSATNHQEEVLQYFEKQEELRCDPLYLAVTLGNISLLYKKLKQEHRDEAATLEKEGKPPRALQGIKVSFKDDSSIHVAHPHFFQGLTALVDREGRLELELIRRHLVKLLRWFDYKDPNYQTILQVCRAGIKAILKGYHQSQKITISPSADDPHDKAPIVLRSTTDIGFVTRILKHDMNLLAEAMQQKTKDSKRVHPKVNSGRGRFVSMHQRFKLAGVAKTIDDYMKEQVRGRWSDSQTVTGIVQFFNAKSTKAFSHYGSIESLVSQNPAAHQLLKAEVRKEISKSLANRTIKINEATEEKR